MFKKIYDIDQFIKIDEKSNDLSFHFLLDRQ